MANGGVRIRLADLNAHLVGLGVDLGVWGSPYIPPPSSEVLAAAKVAVNQFVVVPALYMPLFFAVTGALGGLNLEASLERMRSLYGPQSLRTGTLSNAARISLSAHVAHAVKAEATSPPALLMRPSVLALLCQAQFCAATTPSGCRCSSSPSSPFPWSTRCQCSPWPLFCGL